LWKIKPSFVVLRNIQKYVSEPVQIQGLTFSGPSTEWLMRVLSEPGAPGRGAQQRCGGQSGALDTTRCVSVGWMFSV
jgi:hypothetical protein